MTIARRPGRMAVAGAILFAVAAVAQEPGPRLSAPDFLAQVRRPFCQDAWGRFSGKALYSGPNGKRRAPLAVALVFAPDRMHGCLVLDERSVYGIEQLHDSAAPSRILLREPQPPVEPQLADFGVTMEDTTFAFIYWDLLRDLADAEISGQACRVMDLSHPNPERGTVRVWFSKEYLFPLQAHWFQPGADSPERQLNLKGLKKHDDEFWFVKTILLRGDGWKTKLTFDHAEFHDARAVPVPPGFLAVGR